MTRQKSKLIFFLPALILILNELIRTFLRPIYGRRKYGLLSETLGWLPNFLAPLGFMSMAIVTVILVEGSSDKLVSKKSKLLLLFAFTIIGLTGFLVHEMTQKGTGLTFDVDDIYATVAGVFLGAYLFYLVLLKKKHKSAPRLQ
jgi:H+/Cl- antiporter ClcA